MPSVIRKNGGSTSGGLGNYPTDNSLVYGLGYGENMLSGPIKPTAAMKGFFKRLGNIGEDRISSDVRDEGTRKIYHEGGRIDIKKRLADTLYDIIYPLHEKEISPTGVSLDTFLKREKEKMGQPIYQLLKGKGAKTSPIRGYKPDKKIDFETFNKRMIVKWYVEVSPYIDTAKEVSPEIFKKLNVFEGFYFVGGLSTLAQDKYNQDGLKEYITGCKTDFDALLKQPGLSEMISNLIKRGVLRFGELKSEKRKLPMKNEIMANCDYVLAQLDKG